jgi:predicted AAA+ superfamily ATPase
MECYLTTMATIDRTVEIPRLLDVAALLGKKSHFLLGPRQTGKTFLVRRALPRARIYDLLDSAVFLALSRNPGRIAEELAPTDRLVVIDEVQRLPELLNEVQRLIEDRGTRFLLTGSSARKLRRGGTNLLGGRARTKYLHPLSARELGSRFDLARAVRQGLLPSIWLSDEPEADLEAYAGNYLQQEIVAEATTRNVPAFSRFLRVAAHCNATIVNFTKVASDAQVPRTTVYEYFEILRDTLILHELPAWRAGRSRKPIASSKWYFFDVGVAGWLQGRLIRLGTPEFGAGFETWLFHELLVWRDYVSGASLEHWRSTSGLEVDFVIDGRIAVEAKATANASPQDLRGLRAIRDEGRFARRYCVCLEPRRRRVEGIDIVPATEFITELWEDLG